MTGGGSEYQTRKTKKEKIEIHLWASRVNMGVPDGCK